MSMFPCSCRQRGGDEIYKMPAVQFPASFSLPFPPWLPLIDQWQNLAAVCFIKCLTIFLFLLAKQGIRRGQYSDLHSLGTASGTSPATTGQWKTQLWDKLTTATHIFCAPVEDNIRKQLKQRQPRACVACVRVCESPAQNQKLVPLRIAATQTPLFWARERVVAFVRSCVCFFANHHVVFSQGRIGCWHLDKCLPSSTDLPFMLNQERTRPDTDTLGVCACGLITGCNLIYILRGCAHLKPTIGHSLQMLHLAWCFAVSAAATLCRTGSQTMDWGSRRIQSTNCLGSSSTLLVTWVQKWQKFTLQLPLKVPTRPVNREDTLCHGK